MKRLILSLFLLAASLPAQAATYTVTNTNASGAGSLRQAVLDANLTGGADTIVFDTAGVFATAQTILLGGAELQVTNALTVDAPVAANQRVTVSGQNSTRIFNFIGAGPFTVRNLTMTAGNAIASYGGAVYASGSSTNSLTMENCTVSNSTGLYGGGVYMYLSGTAIFTNCVFSGNVASSSHGGGLYLEVSQLTMSGCAVSDNRAHFSGGGVWASGNALLTTCSFTGNTAESISGGGIFIGPRSSTTHTLVNCTISGNVADNDGGGVLIFQDQSATMTNCTITENSCGTKGGGIAAYGGDPAAIVTLGNTIVARNLVRGGYSDYNADLSAAAGDFFSAGHNLIGNAGRVAEFTNGVNGDLVGTTTARIDPRLGPLANAGGLTLVHGLFFDSPAIDAGDSALVMNPPFSGPPFLDQRGAARIAAGAVDIGAVEFPAIEVTNANDSGAGSLRDAVSQANALSTGATIVFKTAVFGLGTQTITLTGGAIGISAPVSIRGPLLGVKVSGGGSSRVFTVTAGTVSIERIALINGVSVAEGGAISILNAGTTVSLNQVEISGCIASGRGGGISAADASFLTMTNCTVAANATADNGGGLGLATGTTLKLLNSTVSGNFARLGGGGVSASDSTATLINCTVAGNTADQDANGTGDGGGLRQSGTGAVFVGNTIVATNLDSSVGVVQPDLSGAFTSLGNNLIGNVTGGTGFTNGTLADQVGSAGSPLNPQLGALASIPATSLTRVRPLNAGSPATDTGSAVLLANAAWPSPPERDQRGQFRTFGPAVDIGAVESPDGQLVHLELAAATASEQQARPGQLLFTRSYAGAPLTVSLSIDAASTASAADYTLSGASYTSTGATTFTVTFPVGVGAVNLTLTPVDDTVVEGTETFTVSTVAGAGYTLDPSAANTRTIQILDNEFAVTSGADAGAGSLRDSIAAASAAGGGVITFPLTAHCESRGHSARARRRHRNHRQRLDD